MKNFFHFILTCLVSTIAYFGVLGGKDPWPGLAVAFAAWAIFAWRYLARSKRLELKRRSDEHLFREYMRMKQNGHRRR